MPWDTVGFYFYISINEYIYFKKKSFLSALKASLFYEIWQYCWHFMNKNTHPPIFQFFLVTLLSTAEIKKHRTAQKNRSQKKRICDHHSNSNLFMPNIFFNCQNPRTWKELHFEKHF